MNSKHLTSIEYSFGFCSSKLILIFLFAALAVQYSETQLMAESASLLDTLLVVTSGQL